jgi:hypothetical protein
MSVITTNPPNANARSTLACVRAAAQAELDRLVHSANRLGEGVMSAEQVVSDLIGGLLSVRQCMMKHK